MIEQMKAIQNLMMWGALVSAMCFSSCSNDEETDVNNGAVRITAAIGHDAVATPASRAAGTQWAAADAIGIFMVNHGATTLAGATGNKQYVTTRGDGAFTPAAGHEIYYPMDNSAVDFIAYYPYADNATLGTSLDITIATTQTDATQAATDLMWAKADNSGSGYTKDGNATVALTFGHCLSKLTMHCKVDPSVGAPALLDLTTVTIRGMNTSAGFDLAAGALGAASGTPADIAPRKLSAAPAGFHGAYDAIVLPAAYAAGNLAVDFTIYGEDFTWNVDPVTFLPGYEYIYEVTITRTKVTATGTIKPWNPVNKGPVTAE